MIDISHALSVEGWTTREELLLLASLASSSSTVVEVGSWFGRSACAMAANTSGILYCVDPWEGFGAPSWTDRVPAVLETFCANTARYPNIVRVVGKSLWAADLFRQNWIRPNLVFLDGSHEYEDIAADIRAWKPLLAPGGILAGHDFAGDANWPGVERAVRELIPRFLIYDSIWREIPVDARVH